MDNVVSVERHSERALIQKMVLDDGSLMFLTFMLLIQGIRRRKSVPSGTGSLK